MKSWISSPLAINYLLSLCKNGPTYQTKYVQLYRDLKVKEGHKSSTHIFLSSKHDVEKQYKTSDQSINFENVDFEKNKDVSGCIIKWISQYGNFSQVDIEKHIVPNTTAILCNISIFKGIWKCNQLSPLMKVHNSFSYTEDIRYEARLIELPMQDDEFKLVLIVPNEVSSIRGLFSKLVDEGLAAAVRCVHPLFTFSAVLEAPSIEFNSENNVRFKQNSCDDINAAQIGKVQINEKVLSCKHESSMISVDEEPAPTGTGLPFHFAVLYKDTAIFTGRYIKRVK